VPALTQVQLTASIADGTVTADVTARETRLAAGHSATLYVALAEREVRYSGGNGIRFHPMVVRKVVAAGRLKPGEASVTGSARFDLAAVLAETRQALANEIGEPASLSMDSLVPPLDARQLLVVAFLQDDTTREVLQTKSALPVSRRDP
jgi:hypothetical protein